MLTEFFINWRFSVAL